MAAAAALPGDAPGHESHRLEAIRFGLLSAQQIRHASSVEVTESTMLLRGHPRQGGPVDTRFGTTSRFHNCGTCLQSMTDCPGHPGHHELPYPIPHVSFIGLLQRLCNCFCFSCSAYLLPRTLLRPAIRAPDERVRIAYDEAKRLRSLKSTPLMCPACGLPQPTVEINQPFFELVWRDDVVSEYFGVHHVSGTADGAATTAAVGARGPRPLTAAQRRARARADTERAQLRAQVDVLETRLREERFEDNRAARQLQGELTRALRRIATLDARYPPQDAPAAPGETPEQTVARCREQLARAEGDLVPLAQRALDDALAQLQRTQEAAVERALRLAEYRDLVQRPWNNWYAYFMLRGVADDDLRHLGFDTSATHPSSMVLCNLLIPAIGMRPSVAYNEGSSRGGHDKLTREIGDVIKASNQVRAEAESAGVDLRAEACDELGVLPDVLRELIMMMYYQISQYIQKDRAKVEGLRITSYARRAKVNAPDVAGRVQGKSSIIRDNLMGKRVDYCLRTVVTTLDGDMDEIGVPREMSQILTVPERVTAERLAELEALLRSGQVKEVIDENSGLTMQISEHNRDRIVLVPGMIVARFLRDGDRLLINRQPTLHKPSMMAHRVKLHNDRTLKLHPATTTPYNADHDGDEMNGHCAQVLAARAEAHHLMSVPNHIMHPRARKPVVGLIQDAVAAAYFLTVPDTFLTRDQVCSLLASLHYSRDAPEHVPMGDAAARAAGIRLPVPAILRPVPRWTGKQVASAVLPRIDMVMRLRARPGHAAHDDWDLAPDGLLRIRNGCLLQGSLCKQSVGDSAGGIIHRAAINIGKHTTTRFISDFNRLLKLFFSTWGFSVGIGDMLAPAQVTAEASAQLQGAEQLVARIWRAAAPMESDPLVRDAAEDQTRRVFKALLSNLGALVREHVTDANRLAVMTSIAGSKGSDFNVALIKTMVCQTFVNGLRPAPIDTRARMLPCDPLPHQAPAPLHEQLQSRGFIASSYMRSLTPREAFMHAMGGREGLVDTANKTAVTGYMERQMVKAAESHVIAGDWTVRNAHDEIFQFNFGGDGISPMRVVKVTLASLPWSDAEITERLVARALFRFDDPEHLDALGHELRTVVALRDRARRARCSVAQPNLLQNLDVSLPFDMRALVDEARRACASDACRGGRHAYGADIVRAVQLVRAYATCLDAESPALFALVHLHETVGSGPLARDCRCCLACLETALRRGLAMYRAARLPPGEAVGAMAATSVGEPTTQMTLNTFHSAGASHAVTEGVPRMQELNSASKKIGTPIITAPVRGGRQAAELLARALPHTLLRHVVDKGTKVVYEPLVPHDPSQRHDPSPDAALLAQHRPFLQHVAPRAHPWVVRIELDRTLAGARGLQPSVVADLLQRRLGQHALVIASRATEPVWIIRVYLLDMAERMREAIASSLTSTAQAAPRNRKRGASARHSLSAPKRRKYADFTAGLNSAGPSAPDPPGSPDLLDPPDSPDSLDLPDSRRSGPGSPRHDGNDEPELDVPLHCADPRVGRTTHTAHAVIEWMVARRAMYDMFGTCISGLVDVTGARSRQQTVTAFNRHTGAAEQQKRWVIDVDGANIEPIALLPLIDRANLCSNNVMAVAVKYGVDAAASTLYHELTNCLASAGTVVDERLIRLIVDIMTHRGYVMPLNRHGLNRLCEHGVLAKITFEEVIEMLTKAAAFGVRDDLRGVSEKIMLGRPPNVGTGTVQLLTEDANGVRRPVPERVLAAHVRNQRVDTVEVVTSVIPECDEQADPADPADGDAGAEAERELMLTRALVASGGGSHTVSAARRIGVLTSTRHIYDGDLGDRYHRPTFVTQVPEADAPVPFRPASPTMLLDEFTDDDTLGGVAVPFCPTSPEPFYY
jgi:DNA-directed RNA polymerase beta' subunit